MSDVRTAAFRRIRELAQVIRDAASEQEGDEVYPSWVVERATEIDDAAAVYASSQESVEEKGRRLLIEGRLTLTRVTAETGDDDDYAFPIVAECKGDSGEVYRLGYDAKKKQWRCTCPKMGRSTRCSHLVALQLVAVKPEDRRTE